MREEFKLRLTHKLLTAIVMCTAISSVANGQLLQRGKSAKRAKTIVQDSTDNKQKKYAELLKNASTDSGMFAVHTVKNDYYFEIPDSLMGRDLLMVNKISGVPYLLNDAGINKGMGFQDRIIRFHKDTKQNKVWVVTFSPGVNSPETDAITKSVKDNFRETIFEQFAIEAFGKDSASVVIKVNKVFDGTQKSFNNIFGGIGLLASPNKELSKIESIRAFPENIVAKSLLSASHSEGGITVPLSMDVTTNIVLLSKEPMKPRFADDRVGFFATDHIYFSDTQQKVEKRSLVNRWRLEPRPEDVEKYKRGELVEPMKPIKLYIDPATPPVWVPYIKKGIEEWQVAFEAAGFKNAIQAFEVDSVKDADFDLDDVRYSVITYAASERANAMGPSVVDPRSGEIIEADIIWWHNVMSLLHSWIRLQTGAVDPNARGNTLPNDLMGNAVRFVSSHELGHSLGMKHNMGASYSVPVDSLRSKTYTSTNGTASSIMDYARFNYVAQPEDGITELTPRIGTYDKYAINWAYRWLDTTDAREELKTLNSWIREHENDIEYWYGEQSAEGIDPRSQSEDLGNDAVRASLYGIANLKRIVPNIIDWTSEDGQLQFECGKLLFAVISQWRMYSDHVMTNVGGYYIENVVGGRDINRYTPVDADYQRQCTKFIIDEVLTYPEWLFESDVWQRCYAKRDTPIGQIEYSPYNIFREVQAVAFFNLLSDERLMRMYESSSIAKKSNSYLPEDLLNDLTDAVFVKRAKRSLSIAERVSQKNYVDALIVSLNLVMAKTNKKDLHGGGGQCCNLARTAPDIDLEHPMPRPETLEQDLRTYRHYYSMMRVSEAATAKRAELKRILDMAKSNKLYGDSPTKGHYADIELRIVEALKLK